MKSCRIGAFALALSLGFVSSAAAQMPDPALIRQLTERPAATRPAAASTTQPATSVAAVEAPATQPATADEDAVVPRELAELDLVKVFKGEKHLSPEQVFQLGYWVDFAKDFVFGILKLIPRIFVACFLFALFWLIYRGVRRLIVGGMSRAGVDPSIRDMLSSLLKWSILGFGLVIAGNQIGIQITALLTGVSIIGLSVGFAAQTTLANFIAGIVIFWDKPFKVGDWVLIDGVYAQVKRVTFRSTRLLNKEGEVVVFANTAMLNTKLLNHTTEPVNRVTVPVKVKWEESIDDARALLLSLLSGDRRVCTRPAPGVVVESLGDAHVNLLLLFWVADESVVFDIRYEYLEKAKKALDADRALRAAREMAAHEAAELDEPMSIAKAA